MQSVNGSVPSAECLPKQSFLNTHHAQQGQLSPSRTSGTEQEGDGGPAHRRCGKEDALSDLPVMISDSQGHFTADPQCVTEQYVQE